MVFALAGDSTTTSVEPLARVDIFASPPSSSSGAATSTSSSLAAGFFAFFSLATLAAGGTLLLVVFLLVVVRVVAMGSLGRRFAKQDAESSPKLSAARSISPASGCRDP